MRTLSSLIERSIPTRIALYFISASCLIYIYFIGFVDSGNASSMLEHLVSKLSALQCLQIYFIIDIIHRIHMDRSSKAFELVIILAISMLAFGLIFRRPEYALAIVTIAITLRYIKEPVVNVAALAIAAFSFQYAAAFGPLFLFHQVFAYLDAAVVRFFLTSFGFAIEGVETFIQYPPTGANLNVNVGCTSSLAMAYAVPGALIYMIYQKAELNRHTVIALLALLLTITLINWLRMGLMIESRDAYKFWHEGTGMQIVALINAVAILGIMHVGIETARGNQNARQR